MRAYVGCDPASGQSGVHAVLPAHAACCAQHALPHNQSTGAGTSRVVMERTVAHTSVNLGIASCSGRTLRAACPSANRSFALHRAAKRSIMPGAWQTTNSASDIQHTVVAAVAAPPRVASPEQSPLTSDVGPKDAPLRSLFPPKTHPPRPERPSSRWPSSAAAWLGFPPPSSSSTRATYAHTCCAVFSTTQIIIAQEVDIYEQRPFVGGKVASFKDKDGNHIGMGLHVFFGCYFNLFRLMAKCGVLDNLLLKVRGSSERCRRHACDCQCKHRFMYTGACAHVCQQRR